MKGVMMRNRMELTRTTPLSISFQGYGVQRCAHQLRVRVSALNTWIATGTGMASLLVRALTHQVKTGRSSWGLLGVVRYRLDLSRRTFPTAAADPEHPFDGVLRSS